MTTDTPDTELDRTDVITVTATQSFEITQTTAYEFIDEYTEYECVPEE